LGLQVLLVAVILVVVVLFSMFIPILSLIVSDQ